MIDPSDLTRRASELTELADHEDDPGTRQRLLRMAKYYLEIAEIEQWAATHPTSIASIGEIFVKK
ncbi:hypothetical protein ABIB06_002077 [Bradyrhizobium sp. LB8.2]|uniref:hypothetical protein n=1 Tax=unclassified Bradyrhizobium TaxID=2631580 RepID=UPI001FF98B85|nr:hypothetical protein [Bradyrhizobium sp. 197]MCK1478207.1 hypothetical protein [Bradyrhizobium sp. 197]